MAQQTPDVFQVIADPSRRQILEMLSQKSMTISALAGNFEMSRPAVSKHIKILNQAGFISIQDIGRERYCLLQQDGFDELQNWIAYFDDFWQSKLQNLATLLTNQSDEKNVKRI